MPGKTLEELEAEAAELECETERKRVEIADAKVTRVQDLRAHAADLVRSAEKREAEAIELRDQADAELAEADALEGKPTQKRTRNTYPKPTPREVHDALKLNGPQSCAELAASAGWGKGAVQAILNGLEADGKVCKAGAGRWTQWSAA